MLTSFILFRYCPECKTDDSEIVKAGEKLKTSKKKERMPSSKTESTRDWGKGMACVGRTKECTLVEKNHFGPIPGVEVGTCWKYRIQVDFIQFRSFCLVIVMDKFSSLE